MLQKKSFTLAALLVYIGILATGCGGPEEKACDGTGERCGVDVDSGNSGANNDGTSNSGNAGNVGTTDAGDAPNSGNSMTDGGTGDAETRDGAFDCRESLSGTISGGTLAGDCLYEVESTLQIEQNVTIEAGAVLEFQGLHSVIISGVLDARGTASDPVVFRSNREGARAGDWGNIYLVEGSSLRLDNARVSDFSGIRSFGGTVQIFDSEITNVRPANQTTFDIEILGAIDLGQDASLALEGSRLADVVGETDVGISSFDADGIQVTDSILERVGGTAFVISGFGDSSAGLRFEHNRVEGCGAAGAVSFVASSTIENNEFIDNDASLSAWGEEFGGAVNHSFASNNFTNGSTNEVTARYNTNVDATGSFWGAGVNPADVVEATDGADIDTADAVSTALPDAGPR